MIKSNFMPNIDNFTKGYFIFRSFYSNNQINLLHNEIDALSQKYIFNGNSIGTVWFNRNYFDIYNPITNINSINLLETAIDISKLIFKNNYLDYRLTNLRVSTETKNSFPLKWHTDTLPDVIRAIIYLDKVNENNGALSVDDNSYFHKNDNHKDKENSLPKIKTLNCDSGDLLFFDPNIRHTKNPVLGIRRTITFEFQHSESILNKYSILIDNSKLNKKIINNFQLFNSNNGKSKFELNVYSNKTPNDTPISLYLKLFLKKILNYSFF